MKKIVLLFPYLFLLIFTFRVCFVNSFSNSEIRAYSSEAEVLSSNIDDNINNERNRLTSYYSHLSNNFGENSGTTCTQVAFGMLLSFYDTYYDDRIIPEVYDKVSDGTNSDFSSRNDSPGIRRETDSTEYSWTSTLYYEYLQQKKEHIFIQDLYGCVMNLDLIMGLLTFLFLMKILD